MSPELASLDEIAEVLRSGGYEVRSQAFETVERVLLAESPYALVCCFQGPAWDGLPEKVSDVQAELTQMAATSPSPRQWDLYVVVHMLVPSMGPTNEELVETMEADTRYSRKFIRLMIPANDTEAIEKALLPLLPLRPVPLLDLVEPVEALRQELYELDVPTELADAALDSFVQRNEVDVP